MSRIFISYRRSISRYSAETLYQFCINKIGRGSSFRDYDAIRPGDTFPNRIINAVAECEVFLLLIGPKWCEVADENGLRLAQESDWVRREVEIALRRQQNGEPVLIIPLVEPGADRLTSDQLPDELRPLCDIQFFLYRNGEDLESIVPIIEQHLGSPPMGDFGMKFLGQMPELSRREQHRFRRVQTSGDLEPFVSLSDAEDAITEVNPGLLARARWELYDRWCQWTAKNEYYSWNDPKNHVTTFLILDQKQEGGTWLPIAVSILLPLTVSGAQHLRLFRKADPSPWEKRNAATLQPGDVSRMPTNRLLIDTWIVRRRGAGKPVTRYEHYRWANGLLLRHISDFWDPDAPDEFKFFCEPDNPRIAFMLNDLRFYPENRNRLSGNLFLLKYPLEEDRYGDEDKAGIEHIKANIRAIRNIPIVTGSEPPSHR